MPDTDGPFGLIIQIFKPLSLLMEFFIEDLLLSEATEKFLKEEISQKEFFLIERLGFFQANLVEG